MEKVLGYLLVIVVLAGVVLTKFWAPTETAKSTMTTCLELEKQAAAGGAELQKKAYDACKIADAQTEALHRAFK